MQRREGMFIRRHGEVQMDQRGQASLNSMAPVASPSTSSNRAEFDDDDEHCCAAHGNRGTAQGGQKV
jgi:hypothetical protein